MIPTYENELCSPSMKMFVRRQKPKRPLVSKPMRYSSETLREQLLLADTTGFFHRGRKEQNLNSTEQQKKDKPKECHRCKKGNFIHTARQTRSADEGMTLILICDYCGFQKQ